MALGASRNGWRASVVFLASALWGAGCSGGGGGNSNGIDPDPPFVPPGISGTGGAGGSFPPPIAPPGRLDERPVIRASSAPRPIQGGTLALSPDDRVAVVADADRDRIVLVDVVQGGVLATLPLGAGAEPGRVQLDGEGRAHVALRGTGEVVAVDLDARELGERRAVCGVPSGLAYDAARDELLVACQGGELVTLPAAGGPATRTVRVEQDLRDVVLKGERVFVSSFKRAELLELDAQGGVVRRTAPQTLGGQFFSPVFGTVSEPRTLEPAIAWRTLETPAGVMMLHQRAQLDDVDIGLPGHGAEAEAEAEPSGQGGASGGSGACFEDSSGQVFCDGGGAMRPFPGGGGGYGSGGPSCDGIVATSVTEFDGALAKSSPPILGAVLAVDGAMSPDGRYMAIALAGSFEDQFFVPSFSAFGGTSDGLGVVVLDTQTLEQPLEPTECLAPGQVHEGGMLGSGQSVSVAFDSAGKLVVQTRDPNRLRVYEAGCIRSCQPMLDIALGGEARRDTGHDLFHVNAGGGLACASCHPGGGDDGRTWHFKNLGPRRTQLFTMGIRGTEPLHWDGDLPTLSDLMGEVFVRRMGGARQTQPRIEAMGAWLETLQVLPALRAHDDPAAQRGKALFESTEVQCSSCHNGEKLTNNKNADVGTGGAFQVPSLINVAYHQPYIHDGCAKTLHERFDPACGGGDKHGKTSHLTPAQIDDLVAYLETL